MSDLHKSISRALRGPKPTPESRWVTTLAESQWDGERYVSGYSEGYWYEGAWSLAHDVTAVYSSPYWNFRNDDGSEATATDLTAGGDQTDVVKADGVQPGHNIRLRVALGETAGASGAGEDTGGLTLQFSKNSGTWTTVGAATDVSYYDSPNLTNGTAITTQRLTSISGATFRSTHSEENEDGVSVSQPWSKDGAEVEFSIQFHATNTVEDDSIDFRLLNPGGAAQTLTGVPNVILAAPPVLPDQTADGDAVIGAITAAGTAERIVTADGDAVIGAITADGAGNREVTSSGDAVIGAITVEGVGEVEIITATGDATIAAITAEGVSEVIRTANGGATLAPFTAAGNSFIWPKVYLNTTESLSGATEMTVSSVEADGTQITFDDSVGAPLGSLFLGVENRNNSDVGWIPVTVTSPVGPVVVFGSIGA